MEECAIFLYKPIRVIFTISAFGDTRKGANQIPGLNSRVLSFLANRFMPVGNFLLSQSNQSPHALFQPSSNKIYSNAERLFFWSAWTWFRMMVSFISVPNA